jgi:hypothetical protein
MQTRNYGQIFEGEAGGPFRSPVPANPLFSQPKKHPRQGKIFYAGRKLASGRNNSFSPKFAIFEQQWWLQQKKSSPTP